MAKPVLTDLTICQVEPSEIPEGLLGNAARCNLTFKIRVVPANWLENNLEKDACCCILDCQGCHGHGAGSHLG
jgi:hypothetical protein